MEALRGRDDKHLYYGGVGCPSQAILWMTLRGDAYFAGQNTLG
ncbi:hypothetical protein NAS141_10201 [Sulfitobacter sp. NAS-14.1]|nr:hypothetical protein NAS141_10201 [Sulfitobacter sp. NAS-14.1]